MVVNNFTQNLVPIFLNPKIEFEFTFLSGQLIFHIVSENKTKGEKI